jgi:hypothetical protein
MPLGPFLIGAMASSVAAVVAVLRRVCRDRAHPTLVSVGVAAYAIAVTWRLITV